MRKKIRLTMLPLLLAAMLALPALSCGDNGGDANGTGGGELTGPEAKQVMTDSMLAMNAVTSYSFSMDMEMDIEATGGSSPGEVSATMESDGSADTAAKKMKMNFAMSFEAIDIAGQDEDMMQDISAEMYLIEDEIYVKMDMPEVGEEWVKMPLTGEMEEAYNLNMLEEQLAPIKTATDITYIKSENIDGADCYVLNVTPDMTAMMEWLNSQPMATDGLNFDEVENLEDVFKELSYTVWVDKESKLMRQMSTAMVMEMNPGEFGADESEFDLIQMDISMEMKITDFNENISIDLPEEAEDARESF